MHENWGEAFVSKVKFQTDIGAIMNSRYPEAVIWLREMFKYVIVDGQYFFQESTFEEMHISFLPGVQFFEFNDRECCSINDEAAQILCDLAEESAGYYDAVTKICAINICAGAPLPLRLRSFSALELYGGGSRPKHAHRPRKKNWMELSFIYNMGLRAQTEFELYLTRNDEGSGSASVCDALAESLSYHGYKTSYGKMKRLFMHRDYACIRKENEFIKNMWQPSQKPHSGIDNETPS